MRAVPSRPRPEALIPAFGLRRMRPFPAVAVLPHTHVVLDPVTQTGRWLDQDGTPLPVTDARHKKSETNKETKTKTSLDGQPDHGSDQEGDTD